ncbi:MAG: DNA mismatch repair endonuclease MutL, partial [Chthoniobacterales bacterium]|nr:DNA mismatch repair endonuclease MutL [Chthoniobacterales bacterium]
MVKSEGYGRDGVGYKKGEGRIRLLPDEVASQVAAGEVVERPASVLKELIENSLDAEARSIDVEFAYGGVGLIFVRDDGVGMNRDDALLSLERHATSKIRCAEDLFRISTYGFRGEALPSIASVSKFRLVTRPRDESLGTAISVEGGKILSVQDSGEAPGTSVEVRSLFFNIPARRKFLRSELTETGHLLHCFQTFALAHPSVGFTLRKDNRILYQLASSGDLTTRVFDLFGEDWKSALLPFLEIQIRSIRIRGMFSALPPRYYGRSYQYFFLNNRPITDPAILRGIRSALPVSENDNRLPACILFLEMSPEKFDCNVHPAKRE